MGTDLLVDTSFCYLIKKLLYTNKTREKRIFYQKRREFSFI